MSIRVIKSLKIDLDGKDIIREHEKILIQLNSTDKAPAKNGICEKNNLLINNILFLFKKILI